jgi:hypothetical protein
MHFIVVPVKFDGGLSMSILRKKQLFHKPWLHCFLHLLCPCALRLREEFPHYLNPALSNSHAGGNRSRLGPSVQVRASYMNGTYSIE